MFVLACVVFNGDKLAYITYPTDRMGRKCTLDNQMYNYLYFTAPNDGVHVSYILDEKIVRVIMSNRQLRQTEMPPNQRSVMFKKLQPPILSPNLSISRLININRPILFSYWLIFKTKDLRKCKFIIKIWFCKIISFHLDICWCCICTWDDFLIAQLLYE